MNGNIKCLIKACQILGVSFKKLHKTGNLLEVEVSGSRYIFANWLTPLLSHSLARVCTDKDYSYSILKDFVLMPKTISFLDPNIIGKHSQYIESNGIRSIVSNIESEFEFPVVIKANRLSQGTNVFCCDTPELAYDAIKTVFNREDKNYDYVVLAQQAVSIKGEYRVVALDGRVELVYLKDTSSATINSNLSPLHWSGSKALYVEPSSYKRFQVLLDKVMQRLPQLRYCGFDFLESTDGKTYLLELNCSPGYEIFIEDNGEDKIVELYVKILNSISV